MRRLLLPLGLLVLAACDTEPATANFAWQGTVPEGAWVRIRNGNGRVEVRRSPDARTTIGAEVRTGGMPVSWVHDSASGASTFCVLFGRQRDASCEQAGRTGRPGLAAWVRRITSGRAHDQAQVRYVLYVPEGARIDLETVNGALDVRTVVRAIRARTVNGKVTAHAVTGGIDAGTVNGSIEAALDLTGHDPVSLESVNGSVSVELPASVDGDVRLSTVNGRVTSDFALAGEGRKQRQGTIGDGGRLVELKTVNGSVALRRRG